LVKRVFLRLKLPYMNINPNIRLILFFTFCFISTQSLFSQSYFDMKFKKSTVYAGLEVGSKGVKMTVLEVGKNAQNTGTYNALKDTTVNTDFISFNPAVFTNTLNAFTNLFQKARQEYEIPSDKIFTVVSSGVLAQAEKEMQMAMVNALADSFRIRIDEPQRKVQLVDVTEEARLSHLGIVPESKRYTTFLIDIGSGNTKGGYFPNGNTNDLKLFQLTWGTKSIANGTEKRMADDISLANYKRQLYRVLEGPTNTEIIYAVNVSGAYNMSDNIAFSGGIAWAVANLLYPELMDNPVVPVTYAEIERFSENLYEHYADFTDEALLKKTTDNSLDKSAIAKEIKTVNKVFDQRALMAGTGLLLKIMRQFEGLYDKKEFFLVKSGQVGWISAFVDQNIAK
jgi:hypothetical protein